MDTNMQMLINHHEHFVNSRLESARSYRYGNGSIMTAMIGTLAAAVRRASATVEHWARGGNGEVAEYRLPTATAR